MSQQYGQYGGNPYSGTSGGGGYEAGYGSSNPYGGGARPQGSLSAPPPLSQQTSNYSQPSQYDAPTGGPVTPANTQRGLLSNEEFLRRVERVKASIRELTGNIGEIGTLHQRALGATDNSTSTQLEHIISRTQILNTEIKDEIRFLETDAKKSGTNTTKNSQSRTLKQNFQSQLEEYQREEVAYKSRYQDQIARQYRIVNPNATEEEVHEAAQADWGNEGVFQTALRSNRAGHAQTVLGAVRARHNDIQQIEKNLLELNEIFQDLARQVELDDPVIADIEGQTENVNDNTKEGLKHIDKGIKSARNARKLKFWCLGITILILVIIGVALGVYFGLNPPGKKN